MTDQVTGQELRQIVERIERLEAEKQDAMALQKEVYAEAKGRGYCVQTLKVIVRLRKQPKEKVDEERSILEVYMSAIGM